MVGTPWHVTRNRLIDEHGATFPIDELRATWIRHFDAIVATRLSLKPGAADLLDTLDEMGLPRAIATSSSHKTAQHHLTAHDLVERFHEIVAHGDYAAGKPAPDPYLKAAERLGVEPLFCLALRTAITKSRSASAAGMMTIMVPDLLRPTDEIRALCMFVLDDLHAVRRLVLAAA